MELTQKEWQTLKDLRDCMVKFRNFCIKQESFTEGCCNDPDAECPIAMGEWWGNDEERKLKAVSDILFPPHKTGD